MTRIRLGRRWWIAGLAVAVLVVIVLAPLASGDPDGLERVAGDTGFVGQASNMISGLLSGYEIPGIGDPAVSKVVSGLLGVAIVFLVIVGVGRLLARRRA
jgi:PDGLE domain